MGVSLSHLFIMIPSNFILFELQKKVEKIDERWLIDSLIEILVQKKTSLEELNKKQLREGKKSDDTLFENYSQTTIFLKQREGFDFKGHTRIQLFDEGDFQSELFLSIYDDKIFFGSTDSKTNELTIKYGDNIFGLNSDNINIVVSTILEPELIKKVREAIF